MRHTSSSNHKPFFLITIDSEGDNQWSEQCRGNISTENAKFLPRFQSLCEKYGYKPTYLTNYEMVLDKFYVQFAKECLHRNTCEIGSHLHAWNSPPAFDLTSNDSKYSPYLIEYPEEIMYQKAEFLTNLLESTFEVKMLSHRAGRWGFNEVYARILERLGYKVDCSVTPFVSWKSYPGAPDKNGGPDFTNFPTKAYFLDENDISRSGKSSILEIPMTIKQNYGASLSKVYTCLPFAIMKRVIRGISGSPVAWFRCNKKNTKSILKLLENELASGSNYVEFMLHSSELMPGASPTFPTGKTIERLYDNLETIFDFLSNRVTIGMTCFEFYEYFSQKSL